jgi:hypothetical protein
MLGVKLVDSEFVHCYFYSAKNIVTWQVGSGLNRYVYSIKEASGVMHYTDNLQGDTAQFIKTFEYANPSAVPMLLAVDGVLNK